MRKAAGSGAAKPDRQDAAARASVSLSLAVSAIVWELVLGRRISAQSLALSGETIEHHVVKQSSAGVYHWTFAQGPRPYRAAASSVASLAQGLLRVLNHEVAPSEVFGPGLFLRATSRALLRARGARRAVLRDARVIVRNAARRGTLVRT